MEAKARILTRLIRGVVHTVYQAYMLEEEEWTMIRMAKAKAQKDVLIINYEQWFWLLWS